MAQLSAPLMLSVKCSLLLLVRNLEELKKGSVTPHVSLIMAGVVRRRSAG